MKHTGDLFGRTFEHRKTGARVRVTNHTNEWWDFVEARNISTLRNSRKRRHYFDYDYPTELKLESTP